MCLTGQYKDASRRDVLQVDYVMKQSTERGAGGKGGGGDGVGGAEGAVRVGPVKVRSKRAWAKDKWGLGWGAGGVDKLYASRERS